WGWGAAARCRTGAAGPGAGRGADTRAPAGAREVPRIPEMQDGTLGYTPLRTPGSGGRAGRRDR
ncbi:hypothetical protein MNEG_15170, partial [Monoraphidium neglectum]